MKRKGFRFSTIRTVPCHNRLKGGLEIGVGDTQDTHKRLLHAKS